jgi:hypothetical protein
MFFCFPYELQTSERLAGFTLVHVRSVHRPFVLEPSVNILEPGTKFAL